MKELFLKGEYEREVAINEFGRLVAIRDLENAFVVYFYHVKAGDWTASGRMAFESEAEAVAHFQRVTDRVRRK